VVALDALAINQMGDVEEHSAALRHPATHFFVQWIEHAVHLKADSAGTSLTLALAGGAFAQAGEVLFADTFRDRVLGGQMLFELAHSIHLFLAAGIYMDFEVHLGFAMETLKITLKLALVGADGLAQALIILKDRPKTERKDCGVLETIRDNTGVVYAGLLIKGFGRVMFADNDCKVTGGVEEDLVATDSKYGFKWDGFAMAG